MKKIIAFLLALAMAFAFAACGDNGGQGGGVPAPQKEKLVIGTTMVIEDAVKGEYNFDMLSSGVAQIPAFQENDYGYTSEFFTYSQEGDTVYFRMKDSVGGWSDGTPISLNDLSEAISREDQYRDLVKSWQFTYDDKNVRALEITLTDSNPRFISNLTSLRLEYSAYTSALLAAEPDKASDPAIVWYGPYKFESFDKAAGEITFVPNEYFQSQMAAAQPYERIIYKLFNSEESMYSALNMGDIDTVWNYGQGIPTQYQDVLNKNNLTVVQKSANNLPCVLAFNCINELFDDVNVRLGISCLLDYDEFVKYLGSEYASVAKRNNIPSSVFGSFAGDASEYKADIELAKSYLAAGGFDYDEAKKAYTDKDGKQLEFTLSINSSKSLQVKASELIKRQLEAKGVLVNIENLDSTAFNAKTSKKFAEGPISFQAALFGYTANGVAMGNGLATIYVDGNHAVQGGCQVYSDSFSNALNDMAAAENADEYKQAAKEMQDYYAENAPFIALYWDSNVYAYSNRIDDENVEADYNFGLNNIYFLCGMNPAWVKENSK